MPHFKVRIGSQTLVLPDGEHDVGRLPDCWLTIDDDLASRQHARFHVAGPTAVVVDLGSRNGTYVNGERIVGRRTLHDGDKVRVGREVLVLVRADRPVEDDDEGLRKTLAPGEDTRFPTLIGQLVEKSLRVGKFKEAERYAGALLNQLGAAGDVDVQHPAARACVQSLLGLAEHSGSGVWVDRVFQLHTTREWLMEPDIVDRIRVAMDRIPRVPGNAIAGYEEHLRRLQRSGHPKAAEVLAMVAELVDAAGQR